MRPGKGAILIKEIIQREKKVQKDKRKENEGWIKL